jgi:hypothetical protein
MDRISARDVKLNIGESKVIKVKVVKKNKEVSSDKHDSNVNVHTGEKFAVSRKQLDSDGYIGLRKGEVISTRLESYMDEIIVEEEECINEEEMNAEHYGRML